VIIYYLVIIICIIFITIKVILIIKITINKGTEAGIALVFIFNPLWLIKTRLALQTNTIYKDGNNTTTNNNNTNTNTM